MNNNLRIKFSLKFFLYSFVLITTLSAFISCENFLQGEDVKEEITKSIEYNNAPSYTINVEALKGTGTVKTPATGEVTKKVTDVFPIRFEPEDSCKFIKWEAKFQSGESAAEYVLFEDAKSLETKVTFVKAPSNVIIIQPVCPPRLTYTFDLYDPDDPAKKYPKDSSIAFTFNKTLSSGCLVEAGNIIPPATDFIAIQNLQASEGSASTYFKDPEVNGQRLIFRFRSEDTEGFFGYIPVNGQRMISVTIPKEKLWYVNEQYLTPERVYLDSDITRTFYIGDETSAKTVIKYDVKQKDEKPIGVLKVDGDEADNKPHDYSVGKVISLRYQLPEGYAFKQWKFVDSKGNEFEPDDFKLTVSVPEEETSDRLILLTIAVDNYMHDQVTVIPEIYDPRKFEFVKPEENSGVYKVENSALTQEKQSNSYAVGKSFSFSYKVTEGYYFHDWAFKRIYKDENGNQKEASIKKEDLDKYGLEISYELDADEKGYDKTTRLAQATLSINGYTEDLISITPVGFEHLKVTDFSLDDEDRIYTRDSSIVLTFNKPLIAECKDKIAIRIPGLAEDKTFADYFESFVLNQNKVSIYAKGDSVENLLPLGSDGTNTISVVANASDLYYEAQTADGEKVNVSLASNITYSYKINSQTETKTKIKYMLEESFPGSFKVDSEDAVNKTDTYNVGQTASLRCKLNEGYSFFGWEFQHTYKDDQGVTKTEYLTKQNLSELGIEFTEDSEVGENGYDKATRIAQASFVLKKYIDNIITITPLYFENLKVINFNLSDSDKTYDRDSNIIFTFNKPVDEACKDNIVVKIPGLTGDKTWKDYFEEPLINGASVCINTKKGNVGNLIPLGLDGTNTITVSFNADEMYYATQTAAGKTEHIGLYSDESYVYRIKSSTEKKTKLKFQTDSTMPFGQLRVNGASYSSELVDYSMGDKVELTFSLSKTERRDYNFKNWKVLYSYTDDNNETQTESVSDFSEINLQFSSGIISDTDDAVVYGATINVLNNIDGIITIQPEIIRIPDVIVNINGGEHGLSTINGEIACKPGELNHLDYKTDSAYAFIRWQLIDSINNEEFEKSEKTGEYPYIQSSNLDNEKVDFTITDVPDDNVKLELRPVVAERPQIISNLPLPGSAVRKDTTIQVRFDYDMDEFSIYYTDDEIDSLIDRFGLVYDEDDYAYEKKDTYGNVIAELLYDSDMGMYYGYRNGDEVVYKNITIINSNNSENIIDCFNPPVFENPRTLTIGVHREPDKSVKIEKYSQILVTINENMFYWQDGKNVTMAQSKKWIYQVSNATDETGPHYTIGNEPVLKIGGDSITRVSDSSLPTSIITEANITSSGITIGDKIIKYLKSNNSNLKFEISDREESDTKDGSGVASTFIMKFQQLYDDHYKYVTNGTVRSIGISSNSVGQVADFDGNLNSVYSLLNSGIYSVDLIFRDVCGNETTYDENNKWLLCVDKTSPKFDKSIVTWENDELYKLKLRLDKTASSYYKDIKTIEVKQKYLSNSYGDWQTLVRKTDSQGNEYWELPNLLPGYDYSIIPRSYDAVDNSSGLIAITHGKTKPITPKSVSFSSGNGITPTITAVKPDEGACDNIRIRYREQGTENWSTYPTAIAASSTGRSVTLTAGLTYGKIYEFELCSVANDVCSEPYKTNSGTSYPTYTTNPYVPILGNVTYNNAEKSLFVTYTRPSVGDFDGIKIIYSTKSDFTSATTIPIAKNIANGSYTITGLADGTKYYVKVEAWSKSESNKSTSTVKSAYTMPGKVNYLWSDECGTNWMSIDLTGRPTGEYNGYNVYYKLSTESTYKKANSSLLSKTTNYYYIGEGEDGNVIIPGRTYNIKVETILNDTGNSITLTNDSVAPSFTKTMPPETVTNLTCKKLTDTSMRLTWSTPTGFFDGYNIWFSTTNNYSNATRYNTSSGISKTTTSCDLTGLTSKGYYYVWIEPYVGTFNDNDRVNTLSMIRCSLALDAVTGVSATPISTTEIKLSWTNIESSAYDGLEIYRKKSTENESAYVKIYTPSKTATSYSNTGLDPNVLYNYKIVTYKGTGSARLTAEALINRRTYSSSVTSLSASVQSSSEVKLTWTNPTASNYYQIKIYNGSTLVDTLAKGSTSYTVTGLTGATSYTFYVKTTNDSGYLSNSYPAGVTQRTKPVPVTGVKTNSRSADSVTISWTAPASGNYTGFWAHYKPSSSSSWITLGYYNSSTTSCTITGLTAGTKYDFEVQSYYRYDSEYFWSSYTSITTSTSGAKLTTFAVSGQYSNSLYFTWTNLNSANYDYVRIWYKKYSASSWSSVDITKGNTGYTLSADSGCRYMVQAIAYFNGYGTYTDVICTQTCPTTPTNFKVTSTEGVVTASWTPPSGEQSYRLGYKKSGGSWNYVNISAGSSSYSFGTDINNSSEYSFYMWSKMDYSGYGNTLTSVNTSTLTYFTPPPTLPGLKVGASTTRWYITIMDWNNVKSMIPSINVFVDGVYQSGVFNSSTGEIILTGDYENKTITIVPYHCLNSNHGKETIDSVYVYNNGSQQWKTLTTWNGETYGKRFNVYKLDVNNYYSSTY